MFLKKKKFLAKDLPENGTDELVKKRRIKPSRWHISQKQILLFTKNLSILLKAGSTIAESLHVLESQAKGRWKKILGIMWEHVEKGLPLSESLSHYPKVFSPIYRGMIAIGEQSGTLEENLHYLSVQLQKSYAIKKKVFGALLYPAIVLIGTVGVGAGVALFILPKVTRIFKNFQVELPLSTRILLWFSDFFQDYGLFAFAGVVVVIVGIIWIFRLRILRPITHWMLLHIPILRNLSIHLNLALFCRTLSILLKTGTTIDEGLKTCAKTVTNFYYQKFFIHAFDQVKGGSSLAEVLREEKHLFPQTDIQIIQVGEGSGTLSDSLEYCASVHEDEIENITKNLATILEPIILLFMGIMVAVLALAIITPIYSITSKIRR